MKIYWIKAQAPRRALALVKHLGLDVEFIETDFPTLKSAGYGEMNPNLKAPTLVDGDFVLWESSAIMAYLAIKAGSDMWPAHNPAEQIQVIRWLSWNDCHWAPATGPYYFEHVVKATFRIGQPDRAALDGKAAELHRYAKVLDEHLAGRRFVACDRLTIADFQLASMASYWRESEMPLEPFSNVTAWIDGLLSIPAWADPWPEKAPVAA